MHGLKHQKEKRSIEHFAGLDVSVNATSVEREPVSDIDTGMVDSLKTLDPNRPIREADIRRKMACRPCPPEKWTCVVR